MAGNKHVSIHFLPHRPRSFRLSTKEEPAELIKKRHESDYFRADIIITNTTIG